MNNKTLLQQVMANETTSKTKMTEEDYEVVMAYLKDEISLTGMQEVKGFTNSASAYLYITKTIKFFLGRIK